MFLVVTVWRVMDFHSFQAGLVPAATIFRSFCQHIFLLRNADAVCTHTKISFIEGIWYTGERRGDYRLLL